MSGGYPPSDQLPYRPRHHFFPQRPQSHEWDVSPGPVPSGMPHDPGPRFTSLTVGGSVNGVNVPRGVVPSTQVQDDSSDMNFGNGATASNVYWHSRTASQQYTYVPQYPYHYQSPGSPNASYELGGGQIRSPPSAGEAPMRWNTGSMASNVAGTDQSPPPALSQTAYSTKPGSRLEAQMHAAARNEAELYSTFKIRPRKFFNIGKVFLTLWSEPAGPSNTSAASGHSGAPPSSAVSSGRFGQRVYSKIRRFVVVREGTQSCTVIAINTYDGQGVGRKGVRKSEHAIVYTGKDVPKPLPDELPARGEQGLLAQAIRVDNDRPGEKLDACSRIDFGKVYTIEHNIKVKSFGKVNSASEAAFLYQFETVWDRDSGRRRSSISSRPRSARLPPLSETTESFSVADWLQALALLVGSGWSENRARAVLKDRVMTSTDIPSLSADVDTADGFQGSP